MSNFRQTIARLPLVFLGAACGAGAEGEVRGTIHAPPGEEIQGALVIACHVVEGACSTESPQTQAVRIATPGASAPYVIQGLAPGEYHMVGLFDVNGNNVEDEGDWTGHHARADGSPQPVTPPATGVDIRLSATEYAPARAHPAEPSVPRPSPATHAAVPPARTLSRAQRLSGIYHGVTRNLVAPGPGSPVQSGITWTPGRDWITFFPDGRAYHALPPEGLEQPFDWNLLCGINPTWCTTYVVRMVVYAFPEQAARQRPQVLYFNAWDYHLEQ